MDAKELLREEIRMCKSYELCKDCPVHRDKEECCGIGLTYEKIDAIEKWSKEHPVLTNRMKFKEIFGDRAHFFTGTRGCFFRVDNYGEAIFLPSGWFDEPYKDQSGEEK